MNSKSAEAAYDPFVGCAERTNLNQNIQRKRSFAAIAPR
jgi:hypothetical protein